MVDKGEAINPSLVETKIQSNRQESLKRQLEILDLSREGHKVYGVFLLDLYDNKKNNKKNYEFYDKEFSKKGNNHYLPKVALEGNLTKQNNWGYFYGSYKYEPITIAVDKVEDSFNIFPKIKEVFEQSEGKSNREIVSEVAKTVTNNTDVPVLFESPYFMDDQNSMWKSFTNWGVLENGNVYSRSISNESVGMHIKSYKGSRKIISDIEKQGYSNRTTILPIGDVIIINERCMDDSQAIGAILHELGHVVEERYIMPQKENEEKYKNKPIDQTEIISSLYGFKTALLMAKHNFNLAYEMIQASVVTYNWILTGTVAP